MNYVNRITKLNLKSSFLKFLINSFFITCFIFFYNFFFMYMKMSKTLSAKHYQENKERLQKKLVKDTKIRIWAE